MEVAERRSFAAHYTVTTVCVVVCILVCLSDRGLCERNSLNDRGHFGLPRTFSRSSDGTTWEMQMHDLRLHQINAYIQGCICQIFTRGVRVSSGD